MRGQGSTRAYKFLKRHRGIRVITQDLYVLWMRLVAKAKHPFSPRFPRPLAVTSTLEWAQSLGQDERPFELAIVRAAEEITNALPRSVVGFVDEDFRAGTRATAPPAFVISLPNGRVIGEHGAVVAAGGELLLDVSWRAPSYRKQHMAARAVALMEEIERDAALPVRRVRGTVAALSAYAGRGYFHWIWDVLPRVGLLQEAGMSLGDFDAFVVPTYLPGFQIETLSQLGIERQQVIVGFKDRHIQADRLLATSMVRSSGFVPSWAADFLRQAFPPERPRNGLAPKRIYIERKTTDHGLLEGESRLSALLRDRGFTPLAMEEYTLREKAWLLGGAEAVVGPSGAGLSNVVFCQPGTKIIELRVRPYAVTETWDIANRCGLDFYYVLPEGSDATRVMTTSGHVATEDVMATLDLAGLD